MLKRDLIRYRVSIDEQYAEDGETLGIDLISNVKNPAVKIKGVSFSSNQNEKLRFADEKKYRIAAPILVPDDIYRNDDEEYLLRFTIEDIELLAKDFMSKLPNKNGGVFNLEHENDMVNSFLLEVILVDSDSKIRMIKDSYKVDVPMGTFFGVQQFNDKNKFEQLVANGQTGFSIEGFLGMYIEDENKIKMNTNSKLKMMKNKKKFVGTKRVLKSASKKKFEEVVENEDLIMIADELKEGAPVVVVEDITSGPIEDFTGEVEVPGGDTIIIDKGMITEVVPSEAAVIESMEKDVVEPVVEKPAEMAVPATDVPVVEKPAEMAEPVVEPVVAPVAETPAEPADINAKLEDVYKMIAELKVEISALKQEETNEEVGEVVMNKQKFSNALTAFNEWVKNKN